jgi:hypothetical protein
MQKRGKWKCLLVSLDLPKSHMDSPVTEAGRPLQEADVILIIWTCLLQTYELASRFLFFNSSCIE